MNDDNPDRRWTDRENVVSRLAVAESQLDDVRKALDNLTLAVQGIGLRLNGRPSWAVTIILAFLSSTTVALAVVAFERLPK